MSSSSCAVASNVACFVLFDPLKSNVGFFTAALPSAFFRNATCVASCFATTSTKLRVSPLKMPAFLRAPA